MKNTFLRSKIYGNIISPFQFYLCVFILIVQPTHPIQEPQIK